VKHETTPYGEVVSRKRKPNKLILVFFAAIHLTLATLTWQDLKARPVAQIRGNKTVWRLASTLNSLGSVAYWIFGRRPGVTS
jgi:hypothetical protein